MDASYLAKSTALGLAILEVKDGSLVFLSSEGCPAELRDDYIPISITISRDGSFSMKQSATNGESSSDDEGV